MDDREPFRNLGESGSGQAGRAADRHRLDHAGDGLTQDLHDVVVIGNEAELGVQRDVLGQVSRGVMRFRSKHRADLVDPLENTDHRLLEELWRLRQIGRAAEIVHREHVRTGFRCGFDEFRSVDLDEVTGVERGPKPCTESAATCQTARRDGWRQVTGPWSSSTGRLTSRVGRQSSTGGDAASASTRTSGPTSSTPPGALGVRTTVPVTRTTVSSAVVVQMQVRIVGGGDDRLSQPGTIPNDQK